METTILRLPTGAPHDGGVAETSARQIVFVARCLSDHRASRFIGPESLLLAALGKVASKDGINTGGGPNHEGVTETNPVLHTLTAVLSRGPVSVGDAVGKTDFAVLAPCCSSDGTILSPSGALIPIDATYTPGSPVNGLEASSPTNGVGQVVWTAHSAVSNGAVYYVVLAVALPSRYSLRPSELWPPPAGNESLWTYRWNASECSPGKAVAECLTAMAEDAPLSLTAAADREAPLDRQMQYTVVVPELAGGWIVLGEMGKYVPVSPARFTEVSVASGALRLTARGLPGETVNVLVKTPKSTSLVSVALVLGPGGSVTKVIGPSRRGKSDDAPPPQPLCDLAVCGPLHISASRHYLTHRDGSPFFFVADTPWHLLQDVSLAEAKQFIDLRLSQGFTALQLNALGLGDDPNAQGDRFGNWSSLNPPYWAHVDDVLQYMQRRGMIAYVLPIWAFNWACPGSGLCPSGRPSATLEDHFAFGKILGARWRELGNLIWVMGGDIDNPPVAKYRQLLAGIRAGGARQLATAHPRAPGSSSSFMPRELDFFSIQNRAGRPGGGGTPLGTTGSLVRSDFTQTFTTSHLMHHGNEVRGHKPVLMAETWYEDVGDGGLYNLHFKRGPLLREAYWGARLAGSLGDAYGQWGGWCASKRLPHACGGQNSTAGWQHDVQLPGAEDISTHMQRILKTVSWHLLSPDGFPAPALVSAGPHGNTTAARLYAARTVDDSSTPTVVVYARSAQPFLLQAAAFGDGVEASYYDPSGGAQAGTTAFPVRRTALRPTGSPARISVPAQSWQGDGVIVLRVRHEHSLKADDGYSALQQAPCAQTYYVDSAGGNDSGSGALPTDAWRSLPRVNTASLKPGDAVLFKRGTQHRFSYLRTQSGVRYGAYGEASAPKPLLLGSVSASNASDWAPATGAPVGTWVANLTKLWGQSAGPDGTIAPVREWLSDIGNVVLLGQPERAAVKVWSPSELARQAQPAFYYNYTQSHATGAGSDQLLFFSPAGTVPCTINLSRTRFCSLPFTPNS